MSFSGHIYGVILNDSDELSHLTPEFSEKPYQAAPQAPVVFVKPRTSLTGRVQAPADASLVCSPTLAMLIARDTTGCTLPNAQKCIGAVALAVDISLPQQNYYRPAVAQRNADGFLSIGDWQSTYFPKSIRTAIDGKNAHEWSLDRLNRAPLELIVALSEFMTLKAGDVLLAGLPGDAPHAKLGQKLKISADGFSSLDVLVGAAS